MRIGLPGLFARQSRHLSWGEITSSCLEHLTVVLILDNPRVRRARTDHVYVSRQERAGFVAANEIWGPPGRAHIIVCELGAIFIGNPNLKNN